MTRNLRKYLAYHMNKPIPIEKKLKKNLRLSFSGPKVLLFCFKVSGGLVKI